ncbi:AraC family transcriptional regulator [Roseomonas sp. WA12]
MINETVMFDPFGSVVSLPPASVVHTRRSKLRIRRFVPTAPDPSALNLSISMPQDDGFVALYHLSNGPPHEHFINGRSTVAPALHAGHIHLIDLNVAPMSLVGAVSPLCLYIHIPRQALDDVAQDAGLSPVAVLRPHTDWNTYDITVQRMVPLLLDAMVEQNRTTNFFLDHLLLALTAHFCSTYGQASKISSTSRGLALWQVRRAKEIIASNLHREVSLQEIANTCGLSVFHFIRTFKASTGHTPHSWLQLCRVERARDLILKSNFSLADIADQCGFADQSHLTRQFKRSVGFTPGAWRRSRPR